MSEIKYIPQPELMDHWGCTFYAEAETITGTCWWYEEDGKRIPLLPRFAETCDKCPK